jgi:hypothetical protein
MRAYQVEDRLYAYDVHGAPPMPDVVGYKGNVLYMIEVRMGYQNMLYLDLLVKGESGNDPSRIKDEGTINQETAQMVSGKSGAVAAQRFQFHCAI